MMRELIELLAIITSMGGLLTYLGWSIVPPAVVKAAGVTMIALAVGYAAFIGTAFAHGFITELRKQNE